jgi:iron complex transport system ATP-binding protein
MILAGNNLNFSYSDTLVVSDFSIKLERGKIFMLSGPNGSGKSTIIKLICGLLKPDSGNITINGEDLNSFSDLERAKKIGVVAQTQLPILDFTVEELILTGRTGSLNRFFAPSVKDIAICNEVIELLELEKFRNRQVNQLSGGERSRVFLGKGLAQKTQFLLLDEPTSAMDIEYTFKTLELLKNLSKEIGILMVCHDLNLAWQYADKLYLLKNGRTCVSGEPKEILSSATLESIYNCHAEVVEDKGIIFRPSI